MKKIVKKIVDRLNKSERRIKKRLNKDYVLKTWNVYSKKYEKELKYLEDK